MRRPACIVTVLLLGFFAVQLVGQAAKRGDARPKRALPPAWSADVKEAFYADLRELLSGERPNFGNLAATRPKTSPQPGGSGEPAGSDGSSFAWSQLISPTSLEDEVKKLKMAIDQTVDTPGPFKGGGNRDARVQFTVLAVLFAVIADFDGDVRWKDQAAGLRELFAQAGFSCKVGTTQSYNQAKLRKQDLEELIRGSRVEGAREAEATVTWDKVADRPPLMQRMEQAFDKRLRPWLASESEFKNKAEDILREAQILAMISEVIQREGFEYWDDETYTGYAAAMRDAAKDIAEAVKLQSYQQASEAAGAISNACSECHSGYRA